MEKDREYKSAFPLEIPINTLFDGKALLCHPAYSIPGYPTSAPPFRFDAIASAESML